MSQQTGALVYVEADDEITDIIDRVRQAAETEVALVLPANARAMRNPVNVRLLRQTARTAQKRAVVISNDARVQELARASGLPTFASVALYERGVEFSPSDPGVAAPVAYEALAAPQPGPMRYGEPPLVTAATGVSLAKAGSPGGGPRGGDHRHAYYFAAIAVAAIGLIIFILAAPAATVTITVNAKPVSKSTTIQGSTAPADATKHDHILTTVLKSNQQSTFDAKPSGTRNIPAASATSQIVITDDIDPTQAPSGFQFTVPAQDTFTTSDGKQYHPVHDATVNVPAAPASGGYSTSSNAIDVVALTPGVAGNVGAGTITTWASNPCNPGGPLNPPSPYALPNGCSRADFRVTNPGAASGGVDAQNLTVVADADLAAWNQSVQALTGPLQTKVTNDEQTQAQGRAFAVDPGGGGRSLSCATTPALPKSGDTFSPTTFTVACTGAAVVYKPDDVHALLIADLQKPADQDFVSAPQFGPVSVTQAIADDTGTLILSGSVQAALERHFDAAALRGQFAGKSPSDAKFLVMQTLGTGNVSAVDVSQTPFGLPFLPFFSSRIQVDVRSAQVPAP